MPAIDMVPRKLGRYQILKHLASGGMADVLLARADGIEGFERHVVIKRIRADQAREPQFITMFLDEARLAARLHHQNIVQVHDIGEDRGDYFFTMEYLHGEDLCKLLTVVTRLKEMVPIDHVVAIIVAAAAGLHYAHEQRDSDGHALEIVHRDVSPSNIMVGYDGSVKVTDFGIAKAATRTAKTEVGTHKGKLSYMSPEQCLGKPIDRRSDVFGLGIVLYELVTARRLFKADTDYLVMAAIVSGEIRPPSQLRPDVPPALEKIILKALARKPSARYQTAAELGTALEELGSERRALSLTAYMRRLFGERAEPWRVDDEPEMEINIDFDGAVSAVVDVPDDALMTDSFIAAESSPFAKARARHNTSTSDRADEHPRGTSNRRTRWVTAIALAVSVIAGAIVLVARSSGNADKPASAAADPPPSAPAVPTPQPPPRPEPGLTVEPILTPPAPPEAPPTELKAIDPTPKSTSEVKRPAHPKVPTIDPKKPKYDPKALFPK